MKTEGNRIRIFCVSFLCALLLPGVFGGCGDPEPPQVSDVQILYYDASGELKDLEGLAPLQEPRDPNDPNAEPLAQGLYQGTAPGSPVLIGGTITDNTAVVDPSLTLVGQRNDVPEWNDWPCLRAPEYTWQCPMACPEPGIFNSAYPDYPCYPNVPLDSLIRGDRFIILIETDEFEEASDGSGDQVQVTLQDGTHGTGSLQPGQGPPPSGPVVPDRELRKHREEPQPLSLRH